MSDTVDCTGRTIRVGMRVQHLYAPCPVGEMPPPGQGYRHHMFFGVSTVREILPSGNVIVDSIARAHIPVYCNALVMVVADEDGRPVDHPEQS